MKSNHEDVSASTDKVQTATGKTKRRSAARKGKKARRIPLVKETPATIKRLKEAIKEGGHISHEDIKKEFGVK